MRYANHYILNDLLRVLDAGDPSRIRREFYKYMRRYREDLDFLSVGKTAVYAVSVGNGTMEDLKMRLRKMIEIRRLQTVKRCAELLSTQISYR
jgi:hypothetical protein